jgi:hypothetical protein
VLHAFQEAHREPAEHGTRDEAPRNAEQKGRRHVRRRKAVRGHGAHGEPVDEEGARIVEQTLAFENREEALRGTQRTQHGRRGNGVRRSDDGAEGECRRPRHRGHERVNDHGDSGRRKHDRNDDERGNR